MKIRIIRAMVYQTAFTFSSVIQYLVCRFSALCLFSFRQFQAFLAFGSFTASANSYRFESVAPRPWRSVFRGSHLSSTQGASF
ncbi:MAG: DUF1010 domain-containing protein [Burkholderiaceae bacterium]